MLTLGQKTMMRKAIRPFGDLYRRIRGTYEKLDAQERERAIGHIEHKEQQMMDQFQDLRSKMCDQEVSEWNHVIREEVLKEDREPDEAQEEEFTDGFSPAKKQSGATAYDELELDLTPAKKVSIDTKKEPQVIGCLGKQIESTYSKQGSLGLGD